MPSIQVSSKTIKPRIETLPGTKLVGKRIKMSLARNKTRELWQGFMPHRAEIPNVIGSELYSVEVYDNPKVFESFSASIEFEKWAAVKVSGFEAIPGGMERLVLPQGLYAVFNYKGKGSEVAKTYRYILGTWLPSSGYHLDDRPHFAVMGEKYKNEDPNSEEELWVPILPKPH